MNKKIIITLIVLVISSFIILDDISKGRKEEDLSEKEIKVEILANFSKTSSNAVGILEKMFRSQELVGVQAYLSTLAIQDITKFYLYEEYNLD